MPAKSKSQRAAEQRSRQENVRKNARIKRRPSRDDIARMFLWQTISQASKDGEQGRLLIEKMANNINEGLVDQGFDVRESYDVFDDLVLKYSDGLPAFRPKPHLKSTPIPLREP